MSARTEKTDIGGLSVGRLWLAPMAGFTDIAFRILAREYGADLTVTEMVSVRGLVHGGAATEALAATAELERPSCVQLFGNDGRQFAAAAKMLDCDIIDVNMGCPMPKIVKNGDGAALLRTPERAAEIVRALVGETGKPVTVKTRLGYTAGDCAGERLVDAVQKAGACAVTVHGRYAEQKYEGKSDLDAVAAIKRGASVPVIASGDITRESMGQELGRFDAVMIGRAALSDIGLFSGVFPRPADVARRHMALLAERFDGRYTVNQMRKFFVHYFRGVPGGKALRAAVNTAESPEAVLSALDMFGSGGY